MKTNLMVLLCIGILSSISFVSCDKGEVDHLNFFEFHFYNQSNSLVTIRSIYFDIDAKNNRNLIASDYTIGVNESLVQEMTLPFGSQNGIIAFSDSVSMIIGDLEFSFLPSEDRDEKLNVLNLDNYEYKKISRSTEKYIYYFTDLDLSNRHVNE